MRGREADAAALTSPFDNGRPLSTPERKRLSKLGPFAHRPLTGASDAMMRPISSLATMMFFPLVVEEGQPLQCRLGITYESMFFSRSAALN